jgi:hypothetical protein
MWGEVIGLLPFRVWWSWGLKWDGASSSCTTVAITFLLSVSLSVGILKFCELNILQETLWTCLKLNEILNLKTRELFWWPWISSISWYSLHIKLICMSVTMLKVMNMIGYQRLKVCIYIMDIDFGIPLKQAQISCSFSLI